MTTLFAFIMPGPLELILVAAVALLLFGGRLPVLAKDVGRSVFELKRGLRDAFDEVEEVEAREAGNEDKNVKT